MPSPRATVVSQGRALPEDRLVQATRDAERGRFALGRRAPPRDRHLVGGQCRAGGRVRRRRCGCSMHRVHVGHREPDQGRRHPRVRSGGRSVSRDPRRGTRASSRVRRGDRPDVRAPLRRPGPPGGSRDARSRGGRGPARRRDDRRSGGRRRSHRRRCVRRRLPCRRSGARERAVPLSCDRSR